MAKAYKVLAGLDYSVKGSPQRAEVGDVVDDLPFKSVPWLLKQGAIEEVTTDGVHAQQAEPRDGE
jgi:hypothetical protein